MCYRHIKPGIIRTYICFDFFLWYFSRSVIYLEKIDEIDSEIGGNRI